MGVPQSGRGIWVAAAATRKSGATCCDAAGPSVGGLGNKRPEKAEERNKGGKTGIPKQRKTRSTNRPVVGGPSSPSVGGQVALREGWPLGRSSGQRNRERPAPLGPFVVIMVPHHGLVWGESGGTVIVVPPRAISRLAAPGHTRARTTRWCVSRGGGAAESLVVVGVVVGGVGVGDSVVWWGGGNVPLRTGDDVARLFSRYISLVQARYPPHTHTHTCARTGRVVARAAPRPKRRHPKPLNPKPQTPNPRWPDADAERWTAEDTRTAQRVRVTPVPRDAACGCRDQSRGPRRASSDD